MWIKIAPEKKMRNIILYGIAAVLFAIAAFVAGAHPAICIGGAALMFCTLFFQIRLSQFLPSWTGFLILAALTVIVFILMQVTISCGIFLIGPLKLIINMLLMLGAASFLWIITGSIRISTLILLIFSTVVAVIDHLVVQARSFEIQFSDLHSIGVAAQVAGGYAFTLSPVTMIGLVLSICFGIFLVRTVYPKQKRTRSMMLLSLGSVVMMILCTVVVYTQFMAPVIGYQDKYWKYRGSERNGFWVNMIYSASATRVQTPKGYDPDTLEESLETYLEKTDAEVVSPEEQTPVKEKKSPNVIVVMNETFSDVHNIAKYLGHDMPVSAPVTPFLDSLSNASDNVIKGHSIVSVYGGNTANSELEFLSGLSIQFIPRNTVAYNLYMTENNSFTTVDLFNKAGYHTLAIHPEDRTNWQREKNYGYFGFDETLFKDDFTNLTEDDYYRGHVSDAAIYDKVIDTYENRDSDEPLFAFVVTMQNHGGFSSSNFDYTITLDGYERYTGVQEYLSSINNADKAFQSLVEYFESVDEDTLILFYGDHQPALNNIGALFFDATDDSSTEEQMAKYVVPYVFWANYDLGEAQERLPESRELTSLNFLPAWLLEILDMEQNSSPFLQYVDRLNEEVMAMSAMGWYDFNRMFHETSYSAPDLTESLKLYSFLQYNALYDNKNRIKDIFEMP